MDIKDCTQTEDGHPVRIYATDGGGFYPVHGAVDCGNGLRICEWTLNGIINGNLGGASLRLDLTDWREEIPWGCLRGVIQWAARDSDGEWYGYGHKPLIEGYEWASKYVLSNLDGVKMPAGPADWRDSLTQRPEGK